MSNHKIPSMKKIIIKNMRKTIILLILFFLILQLFLQVFSIHINKKNDSDKTINQVISLLYENKKELENIQNEYRDICLYNAQTVAYMLKKDVSLFEDIEELRKVAKMIQVDAIHIFDETGTIIKGTNPDYYGYTFDSGEQMSFFKPMLKDRSLKLCQEISPNTADGKLMQYSAIWSEDKKYIIQVGMEPATVLHMTEKNKLSYIFSLLSTGHENNFYAINTETNIIEGSTNNIDVNKSISDIGLSHISSKKEKGSFYAFVNKNLSYCTYKKTNDIIIVDVTSVFDLYGNIPFITALVALCLLFIALLLIKATTKQMEALIVRGIEDINGSLYEMETGNKQLSVHVKTCEELEVLCNHINAMTESMWEMCHQVEEQRDKDMLTGLYNRFGLDSRMNQILKKPSDIKNAALIMLDADDLKRINDKYGHKYGDRYLKKLASALKNIADENSVVARQGGDEFILFFYGKENKEELDKSLNKLQEIRDKITVNLSDELTVSLRFSYGKSYYSPDLTFKEMLKEADKNMYEDKRIRKNWFL